MAARGHFARRIMMHRRRAMRLRRVARRRHLIAAVIARRALMAQRSGHPRVARRLLMRALRVKAWAVRAMLRSRFNRRRIAQIRRARRLHAQRHAGR
jgi:hypothetical protein